MAKSIPPAPAPAPGNLPKQTEAEKNQILNRQIEVLDRMAKGELDSTDEQVREARTAIKDALVEVRTVIESMQQKIDEGEANLNELRDLRAEEQRLSERFQESTLSLIEERNRGGANANLKVFDDVRAASMFGATMLSLVPAHAARVASNERLNRLVGEYQAHQRSLTGGAGSGDGFVQTKIDNRIEGTIFKFTTLFGEVGNRPLIEKAQTLNRRGARARAYRVGRGDPMPESTLGPPEPFTYEAKDYGSIAHVNNFLLEDNNMIPSIADLIAEDFADSYAEILEDEAVNGVADGPVGGSMDYDPGDYWFTGMLSSALLPTYTIASATRDGLSFNDLLGAQMGIDEKFQGAAKFHMHRSNLFSLRGKTDNNGNFVWAPPTAGAPGTIWGSPYATWRKFPTRTGPAQAGKPFMLYGELPRAFWAGIRSQFKIEVATQFRFAHNETSYRMTARAGMTVGYEPTSVLRIFTAAA